MFRTSNVFEGVAKDRRPSMWIGHGRRLMTAAGISTIILRCHGDTWDEIQRLMRGFKGWSPPPKTSCPSGILVEAQLSGPKAVAMLRGMRSHAMDFDGFNRAVARRAYIALAEVVDLVDPASPGKTLPPVVLDDAGAGAGDTS